MTAPLIGIFGGTFDPVHHGHLRTAVELLDRLALAEVRFMLCGTPPHRAAPVASAPVRLAMLRAAIDGQPGFVADDRELHREGPSYMIDTLQSLRLEFSKAHFALILGMDAFSAFKTWHRWDEILEQAHLVVVQRPGSPLPADGDSADILAQRRADAVGALLQQQAGCVMPLAMTQLEISSSAIRQLVADGRDPRYLVTRRVRSIIFDSQCYGPAGKAVQEVGFGA